MAINSSLSHFHRIASVVSSGNILTSNKRDSPSYIVILSNGQAISVDFTFTLITQSAFTPESDITETMVFPTATAFTFPSLSTLTIDSSSDFQVKLSVVFDGSTPTIKLLVSPFCNSRVSSIVIFVVGTITDMSILAVYPITLVAVIVALPLETPVTIPFPSTVAILSSLDFHFIVLSSVVFDGSYCTSNFLVLFIGTDSISCVNPIDSIL